MRFFLQIHILVQCFSFLLMVVLLIAFTGKIALSSEFTGRMYAVEASLAEGQLFSATTPVKTSAVTVQSGTTAGVKDKTGVSASEKKQLPAQSKVATVKAAGPKNSQAKSVKRDSSQKKMSESAVKPKNFPASEVQPLEVQKGASLAIEDTWLPLVSRLNKDGVEFEYLRGMFGRMGDSYSHEPMGTKINELFTNKFVPKPPVTVSPPKSATPPVYKNMVTVENITKCKGYLQTYQVAFAAMEDMYGIPQEIVVSLLMVETRLGTYLGKNSSFWSLACMAAADSPHRVEATVSTLPLPMTPDKDEWLRKILHERSMWAYKELLALIKYSIANGLDPLGMPGSVYGAIGICQFMPSNLSKYAVDGNKDGKIDLFDPVDAISSVGNYLKEHGGKGKDWQNKDREKHRASLKRYNKSTIYANTILALAEGLAVQPTTVAADAVKLGNTKPVLGKAGEKKTPAKTSLTGKSASGVKTGSKNVSSGKPKAWNEKKQSGKKNSASGTGKKSVPAKGGHSKTTATTPAQAGSAQQATPVSPSVPAMLSTPASTQDAPL